MATNNFLDQAGLGYLWTKILSAIESHSVTLPDKLVSYKAVTTITATEKLNADTLGGYSAAYFAKNTDVSAMQETIKTQANEILKTQNAVSGMQSTVEEHITSISLLDSNVESLRTTVSSHGASIDNLEENKADSVHATQHAKDGIDPIQPESIGAVGYDAAQNLTYAQKAQARENIFAAPADKFPYFAAPTGATKEKTFEVPSVWRTYLVVSTYYEQLGIWMVLPNGGVVVPIVENSAVTVTCEKGKIHIKGASVITIIYLGNS